MLRAAVILLALMLAPLARAEIPGQDAPAFITARDGWLAGEDTTALPALAALAQQGNTAAQILLGRIEPKSHLRRQITGPMDRKTRIALLRMPGGLSGQSWLKAAAAQNPLARAYLDIRSPDFQAASVQVLLDAGDVMSGLRAIMRLIQYGNLAAAVPLLAHPGLSKDYRALPVWEVTNIGLARPLPRPSLKLVLLWRGLSPRRLLEDPELYADAIEALSSEPAYAPVRAFCTAHCPEMVPTCTLATFLVTAPTGSFDFQSPAEPLVSTQSYTTSPRFEGDLRRKAQGTGNWDRIVARFDHCAKRAIGPI